MRDFVYRLLAGAGLPVEKPQGWLRPLTLGESRKALWDYRRRQSREDPEADRLFTAGVLSLALMKGSDPMFPDPGRLLKAIDPETAELLAESYEAMLAELYSPDHLTELRNYIQNDPEERLRWQIIRSMGLTLTEAMSMTPEDYLYCAMGLGLEDWEIGRNPNYREGGGGLGL